MPSFDLSTLLGEIRPQESVGPLNRRDDAVLPFVTDTTTGDEPLLLDTCVYVDALAGKLPGQIELLLTRRALRHSSVALSELVHRFGRLDPLHPNTAATLGGMAATIAGIDADDLSVPSAAASARAGMVTGIIGRRHALQPADRQHLLNDAALFFHALETGAILLSGNIKDMDHLLQVYPPGRVLLYRQLDGPA
jgi:hypothetical protein